MTTQAPTAHTLIKCHEIQADFTLSRATIYRWMKEGKFPKPIHLGTNMVRWKKSDIDNWLAEREAV
ncbi:MAG TPA: DNA-binding protein [Rhodobacteraceae bacterium]|jgi:prophage regulatory protein|nr:DNA-binding protein [Paracoccaceae bacterium]|tara:strand:+ start:941 stop:1138 length:198 start_codon:yes stop_codon:yes gene_type:complete